jgi:Pyridoxamine 5'-phosphate oxidase
MLSEVQATVIAADAEPGTEPLSWQEVREQLSAERSYWVATAGRDGAPHVRPMLAVCGCGRRSPRATGRRPPGWRWRSS